MTEGQLRSKRDEFWDTAPAFDGRKEIWDALRAATVAAEALDFQLSQAILDGANISVPNGSVETKTMTKEKLLVLNIKCEIAGVRARAKKRNAETK